MSTNPQNQKKTTTLTFKQKKEKGEAITVMTAYDYGTAGLVEKSGMDCILVGDSLGMVVLGYENTLSVTMEDMLHHCKAVRRGATHPLLVGDMPFMSYQISPEEALRNAGRFIQEGGMDAVKVEGGESMLPAIRKILQAGIPVMGHLGLTPQSINLLGGFRAQGMNSQAAKVIYDDAIRLQDTGCFAIVLESIPGRLAEAISKKTSIPTIGIGAGPFCNGQVLVLHDILGFYDRLKPRFAKTYTNLNRIILEALNAYKEEVISQGFPSGEHTIEMPEDQWDAFKKIIN